MVRNIEELNGPALRISLADEVFLYFLTVEGDS